MKKPHADQISFVSIEVQAHYLVGDLVASSVGLLVDSSSHKEACLAPSCLTYCGGVSFALLAPSTLVSCLENSPGLSGLRSQ